MADATIEEVLARHEAALMALPRVAGVGIGERDGEPVIKVFVTEEVQESELAAGERVPASLEGYEVDVEETGSFQAQQSLGVEGTVCLSKRWSSRRTPPRSWKDRGDAPSSKSWIPRRRRRTSSASARASSGATGSRPASRRCSSS